MEKVSDSAESRKARGAFFTPPAVTAYLAEWAIRDGAERVLEPSAGDGAFIGAAAERLRRLGSEQPIIAHELHEASAVDARALLRELRHPGEVRVGDFLATSAAPEFDAVIGNPPYVRYQGFTGDARAAGISAALAQGIKLSKLSSSWAPFVIHSAAYLHQNGRLGLVLPAELLSSNYAQEVRDFLLARFGVVRVVLIERHVFAGVQTETLLLLAEGSGGTREVQIASIDSAAGLRSVRFETALPVSPGERWTAALVSAEALGHLDGLAKADLVGPLRDWGRLSLGAVTGNNRFFALSPEEARAHGLRGSDLIPISPAGSSHLRALEFTREDHAQLGAAGAKTLLFRPDKPSAAARTYIALGEEMGVHTAYKCRVRAPWWRTPLPDAPDILFTYMNEATPQLAANPDRLHYLNSVHGLYLDQGLRDLIDVLPLAALSTPTGLSAEITGRTYGGGVLKMEPREAARLHVPTPALIRSHERELRDLLPVSRRLLEAGRIGAVRDLVDEVLFDRATISARGLSHMREAQMALTSRRRNRANSRSSRGAA